MTVNKLTLPAKENAEQLKINEIIDNLISADNLVTTNTDQNITGVKTFVGQKRIGFKQSSSSDKLGFTLYNNSGTEKGYLEYNPSNNVDGVPLMTLGNYASTSGGLTHVGFRKYSSISGANGAYNLLAPLISDAKTPFNLTTTYTNFYLPLGFTDGSTTVLTAKTGVLNISSLLPDISTKQDTLVSGTNIKTINNTSILGSGNIDTKEVFVVYYNQTTYQDVESVVAYGRVIYCIDSTETGTFDGLKAQYICALGSDADIVFTGTYNNKLYTYTINSSDVWTKTVTDVANQDLSNLSATGKAVIDSGWVKATKQFFGGRSLSDSSNYLGLDLSDYLPNDSFSYEILLKGYVTTTNTSGAYIYLDIYSTLSDSQRVAEAQTRASATVEGGSSTLIPVSSDRILRVNRNTNFKGSATLYAVAYKRLGTNS